MARLTSKQEKLFKRLCPPVFKSWNELVFETRQEIASQETKEAERIMREKYHMITYKYDQI